MAITRVAVGSVVNGTGILTVPFYAGQAAGQLALIGVCNKYPANAPSTPNGWTLIANGSRSGGHGSSGVDTGAALMTVFSRVLDGTEGASVNVAITGGNAAIGAMVGYSIPATSQWSLTARGAPDNSPDFALTGTTSTDPGAGAGDVFAVFCGINTDNYTYSGEALTCSGLTFGASVELVDTGTTQGDDCGLLVSEIPVSAGTSAGTITFTASASGSATDAPCGGIVFMRMRELANLTLPVSTATDADVMQAVTLSTTAVQRPRVNYQADWDAANDWTYWSVSGMGSDITASWVAAPSNPWIGGAGRHQTTWSVGGGTVSYFMSPPTNNALTPGRTYRVAFAMLVAQMELASARTGPLRITSRNDAGTGLGETFALAITPNAGALNLQLSNVLTAELSAQSIDLRKYVGEWLIFDFSATSTGTVSGQYSNDCWCDVWVRRAGRHRFLARLKVSTYVSAPFDFNAIRLGFTLLSKNVDALDLYFDEFAFDNNGGAARMPRSPSNLRSYSAYARIRRYDRATSSWKSVLDIDRRTVASMTCSYLAYRIEDRCEIILNDPGSYTATKLQDVLSDVASNPKSLYRLDVYAPDINYPNPLYPSNWPNDTIFWSGILVRRDQDRAGQSRSTTIAATGWTDFLKRCAITKKRYYQQTINSIITSLLVAVTSWPGTLRLVTRTGGLDSKLKIVDQGWDVTTLDAALQTLASYGNFFYGVSVCGYPGFESSQDEFRLIFAEPAYESDVTPPSDGLGTGVGIHIDSTTNPAVTAMRVLLNDQDYATKFLVVGQEVYIDLVSVAYGTDATKLYDASAYNISETSGLQQWEKTFVGFQIVFLDKAIRGNVPASGMGSAGDINFYKDPATKQIYFAGTVIDVPPSFRRIHEDASFVVISYFERASPADVEYTVDQLPTDVALTSRDLTVSALRYSLKSNGVKVQRTITDIDDDSATGRESITQVIESDAVRGWQGAGTIAMAARWAERRNAAQYEVTIDNWRRLPNGSRRQLDNVFSLVLGDEQQTILGTTAQGGDNWIYGSDTRLACGSRQLEIQRVELKLAEGGWEAKFTLGSAPRDLQAVIPDPRAVAF